MNTISEIEDAIEKLPTPQVEELAGWLEAFRLRRSSFAPVEGWLTQARGAARPGETTEKIMTLPRGDE